MPSSNDTVTDTISTTEIRQNVIHKVTLRQELNRINKYSMQYWKGCSKSSLVRADHSLLELNNLGSKFKFLYPKRRILQFRLSACLNQRKSFIDQFTQLTAASTAVVHHLHHRSLLALCLPVPWRNCACTASWR